MKEVVVWRMRSAEAQQLRAAVGACGRENYVRREPSIESGVKLRAAQAVCGPWSLIQFYTQGALVENMNKIISGGTLYVGIAQFDIDNFNLYFVCLLSYSEATFR